MPPTPSDDPSASTAQQPSAAGLLPRDCGTARDIVLCRWPLDGPPTPGGAFSANNCEFYKPGVHVALPCYDETRWNTISTALRNIASAGPSLTFQDFTVRIT
uniref:G_PROTEIN_RECEP_F2_3 domain-containing protein n=1 Tax=Globodera pallida TaxID=36090 RepID=A0A183CFB9_GLOPA